MLFLCCHPALSPPSQLALALRAVGGLTTAQISSAFLVPEATMAQRISRAKATIADAGARFELPPDDERAARLGVVLHVLYLIFNEGYTATSGERLQRRELACEAIRLTRTTRALLPGHGEVAGLLALMLLTHARSGARDRADGTLIPLAEQDRLSWDGALLEEGTQLIQQTLSRAPLGPYQLQAAIAAVHAEAATAADTDSPQVLERLPTAVLVIAAKAVVPMVGEVVDAFVHDLRCTDRLWPAGAPIRHCKRPETGKPSTLPFLHVEAELRAETPRPEDAGQRRQVFPGAGCTRSRTRTLGTRHRPASEGWWWGGSDRRRRCA